MLSVDFFATIGHGLTYEFDDKRLNPNSQIVGLSFEGVSLKF
jgi:hypothetical protein